ncbi:hypothetical protein BV25DRAFT_1918788 [Artomyces pyxidatus]|uniref:Uncharacterized protein n=1 Tax=Artomyces pyxidatus TaxID=48021 RepID=A0ACB8SRU6_9AGAM|nr:hypothetical protein BV25DRAFT_1918788 [Artomyces pyxidatus]
MASITQTAAYKRARRQHLKSTRNRPEQLDPHWTPFRIAEKKYKSHFPPPDLSNVLDLATADTSRVDEVEKGVWRGRPDAAEVRQLFTSAGRQAYVFSSVPGLVLLPSFLSQETQKELVRWSLRDHARYPNETNLDTHYTVPSEGLWNTFRTSPSLVVTPRAAPSTTRSFSGPRELISNVPASPATYSALSAVPKPDPTPSPTVPPLPASALIPRLRWANIGWFYHWGTKQYDFTRGKQVVSETIADVCRQAVGTIPWNEVFEPDAGIVNFYQTKDTLMGHVDRSEVCATSPLVSVSLGNAAVFLIGGLTRDIDPVPILLRSGDIIVMSGPACRRAYHGVPRILENTLPVHLAADGMDEWLPYSTYLETSRININVRQVFPKGFDPGLKAPPHS